MGQILPSFMQDRLSLTATQKKQVADLQKEVDAKLAKILMPTRTSSSRKCRNAVPAAALPALAVPAEALRAAPAAGHPAASRPVAHHRMAAMARLLRPRMKRSNNSGLDSSGAPRRSGFPA